MKFKIFTNNNELSIKTKEIVCNKLISNGFILDNDNYELAIAIGGDGSFLHMIKDTNYNSDLLYVGINSGTLGFLQEVKMEEIDKFIFELKSNKYKIEEVGIQETIVNGHDKYYSFNDVLVRDKDLKLFKCNISIDGNVFEDYTGDGILISTSMGSTAHNLSYGGSIVYSTFSSLQITPLGPLNSKVYSTLSNSIIVPSKMKIKLIPNNKNIILTVDGINITYNNIDSIETCIYDKKIKLLRFSHYNFFQKINEKLIEVK